MRQQEMALFPHSPFARFIITCVNTQIFLFLRNRILCSQCNKRPLLQFLDKLYLKAKEVSQNPWANIRKHEHKKFVREQRKAILAQGYA